VKLLAAVLASAAALVPLAGATTLEPTRVQVVAMEFYYNLSRRTVTAGPAIVQLVDFGQDPHDLRMERVGGTRVYGTPDHPAGHPLQPQARSPPRHLRALVQRRQPPGARDGGAARGQAGARVDRARRPPRPNRARSAGECWVKCISCLPC
jgi:hypothetical protein